MSAKKSGAKRPVGRPLMSRETIGYARDLQHLSRLRSAVMCDNRVSTGSYTRIAEAVRIIERELRKLSKG